MIMKYLTAEGEIVSNTKNILNIYWENIHDPSILND